MDFLWVLLILGANFALSWLNARNVGLYWTESKQIKGRFRAYVVCGYILSIAGFTMVYDFVMMLIFNAILRGSNASQQEIAQLAELNRSILIGFSFFTILPTGFFATGFTIQGAFTRRATSYFFDTGWDSFPQVRRTARISRNTPSALGKVLDFFFDKDSDSDDDDIKSKLIGFVACVILILAILGGYFTASAIMKKADREVDGFKDIDQNDPKFGNKRAKAAVSAAAKQGSTYNTKQ